MKLVASWKHKYFGFKLKNKMIYYVNWTLPDCREWGYIEDWYDGPLKRFGLYFICFQWHYDRWED